MSEIGLTPNRYTNTHKKQRTVKQRQQQTQIEETVARPSMNGWSWQGEPLPRQANASNFFTKIKKYQSNQMSGFKKNGIAKYLIIII